MVCGQERHGSSRGLEPLSDSHAKLRVLVKFTLVSSLNNDLCVLPLSYHLFIERQVYKRILWEKQWSGGSKTEDEVVCTLIGVTEIQSVTFE